MWPTFVEIIQAEAYTGRGPAFSPGSVTSLIHRRLSGSNGYWAPPPPRKKKVRPATPSTPGQIFVYALGYDEVRVIITLTIIVTEKACWSVETIILILLKFSNLTFFLKNWTKVDLILTAAKYSNLSSS